MDCGRKLRVHESVSKITKITPFVQELSSALFDLLYNFFSRKSCLQWSPEVERGICLCMHDQVYENEVVPRCKAGRDHIYKY